MCDTGDGCGHDTGLSVDGWDGIKLLVAELKFKLVVKSITTLSQPVSQDLLGADP